MAGNSFSEILKGEFQFRCVDRLVVLLTSRFFQAGIFKGALVSPWALLPGHKTRAVHGPVKVLLFRLDLKKCLNGTSCFVPATLQEVCWTRRILFYLNTTEYTRRRAIFLYYFGKKSTKTTPAKMESQVRQNYHRDCEAAVNRMVNLELFASYTYTSMAFYFSRDDVALPGFAHFFKENSHEEREHAEKLLSFQNKRGGRVFLQDIKKPDRDEWGSGLEAMQCALQLEKTVNQALLDLHKLASNYNDPHLCDFLESHYLNKHVECIKKLGDHITNLKSMDSNTNKMAEYLFDKHTLDGGKS